MTLEDQDVSHLGEQGEHAVIVPPVRCGTTIFGLRKRMMERIDEGQPKSKRIQTSHFNKRKRDAASVVNITTR